jgi:Domain of unknown function (DUF4169)
MGDPINLRLARKQRKRNERERLAEENRIKFGRTKGEKQKMAAENNRQKEHLDGHKRGE